VLAAYRRLLLFMFFIYLVMTTMPDIQSLLTPINLTELANACSDAEGLWLLRRQQAQGRIEIESPYSFTEEYCIQRMNDFRQMREKITFFLAEEDDEDL